jgi:hypothetical protein
LKTNRFDHWNETLIESLFGMNSRGTLLRRVHKKAIRKQTTPSNASAYPEHPPELAAPAALRTFCFSREQI